MSKSRVKNLFKGKGTSQSRQNLGLTCGEGNQDQGRARERMGEQGVPQPGQHEKLYTRETEVGYGNRPLQGPLVI
jgi:hypothetical protein